MCFRCGYRGQNERPSRRTKPIENRRARVLDLWAETTPIRTGGPAEAYLRSRKLEPPYPRSLREHPELHHPLGTFHPAMVAAVSDPAGEIVAIHRTYLADTHPRRAMFGPVKGCAIRLGPKTAVTALTEGVEDGLAAQKIFSGISAWACLSAHGLATVQLPRALRGIVICPDRDTPGIAAARRLYLRLHGAGWAVVIAWPRHGDPAEDVANG